jgi:hypothetical protein
MRIIDLSQDIYEGMKVYPGHLKTVQFEHTTHEETAPRFDSGFSFQTTGFILNDNGPTHVDSFSHLDPDPSPRPSRRCRSSSSSAQPCAWTSPASRRPDGRRRGLARRARPRAADGGHRSRASPDAESDAERRRWFYTPTDHGGLPLGVQRPAQQSLADQLVATGLSTAGYVTVATIIGLDNVLDHVEGWSVDWGQERGRDPGLYYLRVFGEPGGTAPWGWRLGGHHVSLNNLIADGMVVSTTPCFLGADPAVSPLLGPASLRPLGGTEDLAREPVRSLDPGRAPRAILLDRAPSDMVDGNRTRLGDRDQMMPCAICGVNPLPSRGSPTG